MKYSKLPSQEVLQNLYFYNHATGILYSRTRSCQWKIGRRGSVNAEGYYQRKIDQRYYYEHRLIWMYVYGVDPGNYLVDHIDGDRSNNRLSNLRLVNSQKNNRHRNSIICSPNGKWTALLNHKGRQVILGSFGSKQEARDAFFKAKDDLYLKSN